MIKNKMTAVLSALIMSATAVFLPIDSAYADNAVTSVYEYFNKNDVNGKITIEVPENTTALISIKFTSPEVTDEPYYELHAEKGTYSFDIEGIDTTEYDYRNYSLIASISDGDNSVVYEDTFNVPDGNDHPDSFYNFTYSFSVDENQLSDSWRIISETETQKNIAVNFSGYIKGDVNGDGFVDTVDASQVLAEYSRISNDGTATFSEKQKLSADVNGDGWMDSVDASRILAYYSNISRGGTPTWNIFEQTQETTTTSATTSETVTTTTKAVTTTSSATNSGNATTTTKAVTTTGSVTTSGPATTTTKAVTTTGSATNSGTVTTTTKAVTTTNSATTTTESTTTTTTETTTENTTTTTSTTVQVIDWEMAYQKKLQALSSEYNFTADEDSDKAMYDLADINGDGIPELIISESSYHSSVCTVYVYSDGSYVNATGASYDAYMHATVGYEKLEFYENGVMGIDLKNHIAKSYYKGTGHEALVFYRLEGTEFVVVANFVNKFADGAEYGTYNDNIVTKEDYYEYLGQYDYKFENFGRKYAYDISRPVGRLTADAHIETTTNADGKNVYWLVADGRFDELDVYVLDMEGDNDTYLDTFTENSLKINLSGLYDLDPEKHMIYLSASDSNFNEGCIVSIPLLHGDVYADAHVETYYCTPYNRTQSYLFLKGNYSYVEVTITNEDGNESDIGTFENTSVPIRLAYNAQAHSESFLSIVSYDENGNAGNFVTCVIPREKLPVVSMNPINISGVTDTSYGDVSGYTYSYISNRECNNYVVCEKIADGCNVIARNVYYSYDIIWCEVWDSDTGEYYGWVDSSFINFS
ncbi:MAG: hypothetical protein K2J08_09495 [Ruminococcus sp.]|nr:hypothetical protein [Ruminococcus sp.]